MSHVRRTPSLYDLSLNSVCRSITERTLDVVLQTCPIKIAFDVVWKILNLQNFYQPKTLNVGDRFENDFPSVLRSFNMTKIDLTELKMTDILVMRSSEQSLFISHGDTQKVEYVDNYNFCNRFNIDLFFKLVEDTKNRNKLHTIFQICIQEKGLNFPEKMVAEWLDRIQSQEVTSYECHLDNIQKGLELGVFLGDSGWFRESARVLKYTHFLVETKWTCGNQNFLLIKSIQCLSKWLLFSIECYNIKESKSVLPTLLKALNSFEKIKGRTMCLSYYYVAVSKYYISIFDFNEALSWAVKAVNKLHKGSACFLKQLVITNACNVYSLSQKFTTADKLLVQLKKLNTPIDHKEFMLLVLYETESSESGGFWDKYIKLLVVLDIVRNLHGYFNLHTAIVLINISIVLFNCPEAVFFCDMSVILQAIFIMEKIGVPDDDVLFLKVTKLKLILFKKYLHWQLKIYSHPSSSSFETSSSLWYKATSLYLKMKSEAVCKAFLNNILQDFEEYSPIVVQAIDCLGVFYESVEDFTCSEKMYLKLINICELIFGSDHPNVAVYLTRLACLYTFKMKMRRESAEQFHLRAIKIFEKFDDFKLNTNLIMNLHGLLIIYNERNDINNYNQIKDKEVEFIHRREMWYYRKSKEYCINEDLSIEEKFKCIANK